MKIQLLNQSFYQAMLCGIRHVCEQLGIAFFISDIGSDLRFPDDEEAGYILLGILNNPQLRMAQALERWKEERRALVTVQFFFPHLNIPYVAGDNLAGGYLAAQHLLSLGHRRIGVILSGQSLTALNTEFSMRLQGVRMALNDYGLALDDHLVVVKDVEEEDEASGYEGFISLMALANPPTAVFAGTDYKALGAIRAAKDLGIRVPGDISIIGYDGQPVGECCIPPLTTVDQNTYQFGKHAAEMILSQARGETVASATITPHLVIRQSTFQPNPLPSQ